MIVRLHNYWYFYRDTISRKTATQNWRVLSTHETGYSPRDANPVFYGLGEIIIIIIIIIVVVIIIAIIITIIITITIIIFSPRNSFT